MFFLILSSSNLLGQTNLVPNGSFEDLDSCTGEHELITLRDWFAPSLGTSDCFNTCNNGTSNDIGVPSNIAGYQVPSGGNGYIGMYVWVEGASLKEYAAVELIQPLTEGRTYLVSFKLSCSGFGNGATNQYGVAFANQEPWQNDESVLQEVNVGFSHPTVIADTANWITVEERYVADGTESYLILGNFSDNQDLIVQPIAFGFPQQAYYYVDEVSIVEDNSIICDSLIVPNIITPNNDGFNDCITISGLSPTSKFSVYNRWGQEVYSQVGSEFNWGGKNGQDLYEDGVFFYKLETDNCERSGYVHLFR